MNEILNKIKELPSTDHRDIVFSSPVSLGIRVDWEKLITEQCESLKKEIKDKGFIGLDEAIDKIKVSMIKRYTAGVDTHGFKNP